MTALNWFLLFALIGAVVSFFFIIQHIHRKAAGLDGLCGVHKAGDETISLSP